MAATVNGDPDHDGVLSYLPGQKLSRCTCEGESHPGPKHSDGTYVGRSAPEIDIFEAQAGLHTFSTLLYWQLCVDNRDTSDRSSLAVGTVGSEYRFLTSCCFLDATATLAAFQPCVHLAQHLRQLNHRESIDFSAKYVHWRCYATSNVCRYQYKRTLLRARWWLFFCLRVPSMFTVFFFTCLAHETSWCQVRTW